MNSEDHERRRPASCHIETSAILAGRAEHGRSLAPPLWASSTFETSTVEEGLRLATSPRPKNFYSRYGNPTVRSFEDAVAELEGAGGAGLRFGHGRHLLAGAGAVLER